MANPKDQIDLLTPREVIDLMESKKLINLARKQFSNWSGKIDQASRQKSGLTPIEMRKMEFQAVIAILEAACVFDIKV